MEGLISEGAYDRNRKSAITRYSGTDQNIVCMYWF